MKESLHIIDFTAEGYSHSRIAAYTKGSGSTIGRTSDSHPKSQQEPNENGVDDRMQGDGVFSDSAGNSWHGKFHNDTFLNESGSWVPVTSLASQALPEEQ
jgi:hypothetical protein